MEFINVREAVVTIENHKKNLTNQNLLERKRYSAQMGSLLLSCQNAKILQRAFQYSSTEFTSLQAKIIFVIIVSRREQKGGWEGDLLVFVTVAVGMGTSLSDSNDIIIMDLRNRKSTRECPFLFPFELIIWGKPTARLGKVHDDNARTGEANEENASERY